MKQLQTKCMFASAAVHALLLVALVVGSAFVSPKPKEVTLAPFKMFKVTDDETSGGNGLPISEPAAQPPVVQPQPPVIQQPTPPPPVVKQPDPVKLPDPPKPEPVKPKPEPVKPKTEPVKPVAKAEPKKAPVNKDADVPKPKPEPKKHEVTVDLSNVVKPDLNLEKQKAEAQKKRAEEQKRQAADQRKREIQAELDYQRRVADANAKAQQMAREQQANLERTLGNLASRTTGSTLIEMPDGSGPAFVNYSEAIFTKYYEAWMTPSEKSGDLFVRTEIVVARDGRVLRADIIGKSGDAALDRSVRQALDRVKSLPAFPSTTKDEKRTFKIIFNLKAKRQFG